jgi:hypothetical protein
LKDVFLSDYYELPYYAECPDCLAPLGDDGECDWCMEDEYLWDLRDEEAT